MSTVRIKTQIMFVIHHLNFFKLYDTKDKYFHSIEIACELNQSTILSIKVEIQIVFVIPQLTKLFLI